ncbi:MAG: hypothetical protein U5K54_08830 [Cytophagales bacterium]|nr:hypothetical protein [Cytophagales bacterium]
MIQVIEIDGASVLMAGDFYETLVYVKSGAQVIEYLKGSIAYDEINIRRGELNFIEVKSNQFLSDSIIEELQNMDDILFIKKLSPVLPVLARKDLSVPFITSQKCWNTIRAEIYRFGNWQSIMKVPVEILRMTRFLKKCVRLSSLCKMRLR